MLQWTEATLGGDPDFAAMGDYRPFVASDRQQLMTRFEQGAAHVRRLCAIVRELAAEFGTEHIPIFDRFYATVQRAPQRGWLIDVPHPNLNGQMILTLAVLEHLGW
jgi:hypothetical protein